MNASQSIKALVTATLFALLCLGQTVAQAQGANGGDGKGILTIEGEVTDSTCVVYFKEPSVSGTQTSSSSTLILIPVKLADIKTLTNAGDQLTTTPAKFTIVSLGTSVANSSCSLDGKSFWDFEIYSQTTKTLNNKVYLSSVAAESGSTSSRTNVLIQLKAKVIDDLSSADTSNASDVEPSNTRTLGSQLTSSSSLSALKGFAIGAVYVKPDGTPTAGSFSSPITLSVKYP